MSFSNSQGYSPVRSSSYNNLLPLSRSPIDNSNSVMYTRDWRTALRSPPTYRLGNRTFRFNYHFGLLTCGLLSLILVFYYVKTKETTNASWLDHYSNKKLDENIVNTGNSKLYNNTYPLTTVIASRGGTLTYRIGMVADLDISSKQKNPDGTNFWKSYLKKGNLVYAPSKGKLKIFWDAENPIPLETGFSLKDRSMELSELVTFNGKLLTFDDRTGLVYELIDSKPIPWIILLDGDGHSTKGFKSEWATVKNQMLYVGSMGKEWTTSQGDYVNDNPMFIKIVSTSGEIRSVDWSFYYKLLREESKQISWPGYMIHESGVWSDIHQKWFFLPRRCSKEKYNETRDEQMGCNVLISADERFGSIHSVEINGIPSSSTHGFSSFKFIPGTDDRFILAIKTKELNGKTSTFITSFGVDGKVLLDEEQIDTDLKYEGIEFI